MSKKDAEDLMHTKRNNNQFTVQTLNLVKLWHVTDSTIPTFR